MKRMFIFLWDTERVKQKFEMKLKVLIENENILSRNERSNRNKES